MASPLLQRIKSNSKKNILHVQFTCIHTKSWKYEYVCDKPVRYLNANIQEHGGHVFCIKKSLKILNKELMRTGESKDRQSSSQAKKTRNNLQTLHRNFWSTCFHTTGFIGFRVAQSKVSV
jgi:hypothetical protein